MYILYMTTVLLIGSSTTEQVKYYDSPAECFNEAKTINNSYMKSKKDWCNFANGLSPSYVKDECSNFEKVKGVQAICEHKSL